MQGLVVVLAVTAAILVILIATGVPIYVALMAAAVYLQVFVNNMPLQNMFTGVFEAINKNSLMALPYFIFAGNIIAASSLGERLMTFFSTICKNMRGGLAISCILTNAVFGAISGSPAAATATFGKIIYKPLKDEYNEKLSLGVLTSAGALSSIIPPSLVLIMYGICTESSIGDLFTAGIVPGMVIVVLLCTYLVVVCKQKKCVEEGTYVDNVGLKEAIKRGLPVLVMPVVILGGIYGGFFTPTEGGAFCALYTFIFGVLILKDIDGKKMLSVIKGTAKITCQLFILIAVSSVFGQALNVTQAPQLLVEAFSVYGPWQFLLVLNVLLLIVGCFFDSSAAVLILAPLLLPTANSLGIDTIHLGIVFTINLSIGMFTPPFGMNIFVAQGILQKPMGKIAKAVVPFIVIYIIGLLIVTYIPQISMCLLH